MLWIGRGSWKLVAVAEKNAVDRKEVPVARIEVL
jgi:hypothetical protein